MPHFKVMFDKERLGKKLTLKKYIDPYDFNVIVQSKLADWKGLASDFYNENIGEDPFNPTGDHIKSGKKTIVFERNTNETQ
jgi:hypothetical protein